jgi:hypothetical protein
VQTCPISSSISLGSLANPILKQGVVVIVMSSRCLVVSTWFSHRVSSCFVGVVFMVRGFRGCGSCLCVCMFVTKCDNVGSEVAAKAHHVEIGGEERETTQEVEVDGDRVN